MENQTIKSVKELALHLGIHRKTVWVHIKEGLLPVAITTLSGKKVGWTSEYLGAYQRKLEKRAIEKLSI